MNKKEGERQGGREEEKEIERKNIRKKKYDYEYS